MDALSGQSLLSPTNPTIRKLLNCLKKPPDPEEIDEKWAEKAVRALAKKLRRTTLLEVLAKALEKEDTYSPCVQIPRSLDGRLQVSSRKCIPHVTYCRLWRWPDLPSGHHLQSVPHCQFPAVKKLEQVCINPYHFVRVDPSLVLMGDSSRLKQKETVSRVEHMDDDVAAIAATVDKADPSSVDDLLAPLYPSNMTVEDYLSEDADSVAACSPTTTTGPHQSCTDAAQLLSTLAIDCEPGAEPQFWCTVSYYELNQRVGEPFHADGTDFVVDGFCHPSSADRFCLGTLSNVNRSGSVVEARKHIGAGARFYRSGDHVYAECLSDAAIFVQSAISNQQRGWPPATVVKIVPACTMKIFDYGQFYDTLKHSVEQGFEAAYCLTRMCTVRVSFIKGWGAEYRRQLVTATPCWIELHLNGALQSLDRVISKLPCPQTHCTSNS